MGFVWLAWCFALGFLGSLIYYRTRRLKFERTFYGIAKEVDEYRRKGQLLNARAALLRMKKMLVEFTGKDPDEGKSE